MYQLDTQLTRRLRHRDRRCIIGCLETRVQNRLKNMKKQRSCSIGQWSHNRPTFFFFFFRLFPSGVATADFLSPVSPINCILLRHFNLSHVLLVSARCLSTPPAFSHFPSFCCTVSSGTSVHSLLDISIPPLVCRLGLPPFRSSSFAYSPSLLPC